MKSTPYPETVITPFFGLFLLLTVLSFLLPLSYGEPGTIDFIQYWRSWHLMSEGRNPYDFELSAATQDAITKAHDPLIVSWRQGLYSPLSLAASPVRKFGDVVAIMANFTPCDNHDCCASWARDSSAQNTSLHHDIGALFPRIVIDVLGTTRTAGSDIFCPISIL